MGSTDNLKAEMYLTEAGQWFTLDDYPDEYIGNIDYPDDNPDESESKETFLSFKAYLIPSEATSYLRSYAVVYHQRGFYIFGGTNDSPQNTIARLDANTKTWSKAGSLITSRHAHGVIFDGDNFLVIGGAFGSFNNEVCTLNNSTMTCTEQSTALENYQYFPELFLVDENYGKDLNTC